MGKPLNAAIASIDEMILLTEKKIALLKELRHSLTLASYFGVDANQIEKFGYDPTLDRSARFGYLCRAPEFEKDVTQPNYVVLKDGSRVEKPELWEKATERADYNNWRSTKLLLYKQGQFLFRPDVSPMRWRHEMHELAAAAATNHVEGQSDGNPE